MGNSAAPNANRAFPSYFLQTGILALLYTVASFVSAGRLDWKRETTRLRSRFNGGSNSVILLILAVFSTAEKLPSAAK